MFTIEQINEQIYIGSLDLRAFGEGAGISQKRKLETKGIHFLLKKLIPSKQIELKYNEYQKPFIENSDLHISVSHSHDKLVVILNEKANTGIDIELIREKIINLKHKFLSDPELEFAGNDAELLTVYWAAKEVLYKVYGKKELDFRKHIFIEKINENENNFFGKIDLPNFKKRYLLQRKKIENYILVYILNEV